MITWPSARPVTYGGLLWGADSHGPVYLEMREGYDEAAETSGEDEQPVGGTGMYERNHPVRTRRITLVGHIKGIGATDDDKISFYQFHADQMRTCFEEGVTKTMTMVVDGVNKTITARTEAREFDKYNAWSATVTIVLISVVPQWANA